jgi:hypothetical protein
VELEEKKEDFAKRGLNIAALTYDSIAILRHFGDRKGITYPLLSDPDSEVITAFGILNHNYGPDDDGYGLPFPGMFIIDENGIVKVKFFEEDHRERYTASHVLVRHLQDPAGNAATSVETKHLRLIASASDGVVRPGNRLTLILDVGLPPKMHLYAPGVEGYIPIEWQIPESEIWWAFDAEYPESRTLHLQAINETVPVYEEKLRIMRDVIIGPHKAVEHLYDKTLTLEGSFQYQACDDRICYRPETIPLMWTFQVTEHDQQEVPEELRRSSQ